MSAELERRVIPRTAGEVRTTGTATGRNGISGTAAVIGILSEDLGGFREEITAKAFDKALKTSDIRGLFNHSPNFVLGRVKAGTMRVWADARGLHFEIPSLPKSRADVLEAIERGDVSGCSFSFRVADRGDTWTTRNGQRVRTITEFAEILDCGPVALPAYSATVVSARALALTRSATAPWQAVDPMWLEQQRLLLAELEQDAGL